METALPKPPSVPHSGFKRRRSCANQASRSAAGSPTFGDVDGTVDGQTQADMASNHDSLNLETARRNFAEAAGALQMGGVFGITLVEGTSFDGVNVFDSNTMPLEVPSDVLAIVIACMLSRKVEILRNLAEIRTARKPIIIFCVDEGVCFNPREVHDAHRRFLEMGASDMILQWNAGQNLQLELDMRLGSLLRAQHLRRVEVNRRLEDQQRSMFWPSAHRILDGFPALEDGSEVVLEVGAQLASRTILRKLESGSVRNIFRCKNDVSGEPEVMKAVAKGLQDMPEVVSLWKEIVLLQRLDQPNVVNFKAAVQTAAHVLIFMEDAGPRTLYTYIKSLNRTMAPEEALHLFQQLVGGVAHCHENGVAHRDLKPENIVVMDCDDGRVHLKIVDFGVAVETTEACKSFVGTVPFIAPEVAISSMDDHYNPACVDIWSCGIVFLEILCGIGKLFKMLQWRESPRCKKDYRQRLERFFSDHGLLTDNLVASVGRVGSASFPEEVHASLLGMLVPYPSGRWTITEVKEKIVSFAA